MGVRIWFCELCQLASPLGEGWLRFLVPVDSTVKNKQRPVEICPTCQQVIARDAVATEREACAVLMESDVRGQRRENTFCRLADHMQDQCECAERADAIRARP